MQTFVAQKGKWLNSEASCGKSDSRKLSDHRNGKWVDSKEMVNSKENAVLQSAASGKRWTAKKILEMWHPTKKILATIKILNTHPAKKMRSEKLAQMPSLVVRNSSIG